VLTQHGQAQLAQACDGRDRRLKRRVSQALGNCGRCQPAQEHVDGRLAGVRERNLARERRKLAGLRGRQRHLHRDSRWFVGAPPSRPHGHAAVADTRAARKRAAQATCAGTPSPPPFGAASRARRQALNDRCCRQRPSAQRTGSGIIPEDAARNLTSIVPSGHAHAGAAKGNVSECEREASHGVARGTFTRPRQHKTAGQRRGRGIRTHGTSHPVQRFSSQRHGRLGQPF
jgi:hypothetical protein